MRTSRGASPRSPRMVTGEVVGAETRLPVYEQTVAATGTDLATLFGDDERDCSCGWSGHLIYPSV
jgi:hypothetical protein